MKLNMPHVQELYDFRYNFADPRMHLMKYLVGQKSYSSYMKPKEITVFPQTTKVFSWTCPKEATEEGKMLKYLKPPSEKYAKMLKEALADSSSDCPLLLVPIVIRRKGFCNENRHTKHGMIVIVNKLTREIIRIDIRKYHVKESRMKPFVKNAFRTHFLNYINALVGEGEHFHVADEVDVIPSFTKVFSEDRATHIYPVMLMTYLRLLGESPAFKSAAIVRKLYKPSKSFAIQCWLDYVAYRNAQKPDKFEVCKKEGEIRNLQTKRCVKEASKSMKRKLVEKPIVKCDVLLTFDPLQEKCVKEGQLVQLNFTNEELKSMRLSSKTKFINVDNNAVAVPLLLHVMGKYPYARLILPKLSGKVDLQSLDKEDIKVKWYYNKETTSFDLTFPSFFWDAWAEHMYDPSIRFIVALLSLKNNKGGFHANVLIFDKTTNELERFDGMGTELSKTYAPEELDASLRDEFVRASAKNPSLMPPKHKYLSPVDYCPKMPVFQSREMDDISAIYNPTDHGNCAVWRLWYIDHRLANPDLNRKQFVKYAMKKLTDTGSLYTYIKSYQQYLLKLIRGKK